MAIRMKLSSSILAVSVSLLLACHFFLPSQGIESLEMCNFNPSTASQTCNRTFKEAASVLKISCSGGTFYPGDFSTVSAEVCSAAMTSNTCSDKKKFSEAIPGGVTSMASDVATVVAPLSSWTGTYNVYAMCSTDSAKMPIHLIFSGAGQQYQAAGLTAFLSILISSIFVVSH